MNIENKKITTIIYTLREEDNSGEIIQEVKKIEPFVFLFGKQQVLPDFEVHLKGKTVGDNFEFAIKSDDAYGQTEEQAIVDLPRNLFETDGELGDIVQVGNFIPMKDQEDNDLQGLVLDIGEKTIKIDFNHPLAGKNLFFSGEVIAVRDATKEEMEHGHAHGEGGHQH